VPADATSGAGSPHVDKKEGPSTSRASSTAGSSGRTRSDASTKGILEIKHIEAVSNPMRELIEDLWPESLAQTPAEEAALMALTMRPAGLSRSTNG
jgi:hypothetical protein